MRVLINGVTTVKSKTGVGHYTQSLYSALVRSPGGSGCVLYPGGWERLAADRGYRAFASRAKSNGPTTPARTPSALKGIARDAGYLLCREHFRSAGRAPRFDLYHEPNFIPWPGGLPAVATVHDLSVLLYPQWHPADRVLMHEQRFHAGLKRCEHFIAVSEFTRSEMVERLGMNPARITAIPNGVRQGLTKVTGPGLARVLESHGLTPGYLLYVGTLEPRKNLSLLLRAYRDLPAAVRSARPLVLAGGWGWGSAGLRDEFYSPGGSRGVIHLGYVLDEDLPALYSGATALAYPSHYEGFGLPLLEMMACGGAVLASSNGAHDEVLGPVGRLLDPKDIDAWRRELLAVATDPGRAEELRRGAVERAAGFTWARAAERTLAVYHRAAGTGGQRPAGPGSASAAAPDGRPPNRAAHRAA